MSKLIPKSHAKSIFCLSDKDIAALPAVEKRNPRSRNGPPMKLYEKAQLEAAAHRKWGGPQGLAAEQQKREGRRAARATTAATAVATAAAATLVPTAAAAAATAIRGSAAVASVPLSASRLEWLRLSPLVLERIREVLPLLCVTSSGAVAGVSEPAAVPLSSGHQARRLPEEEPPLNHQAEIPLGVGSRSGFGSESDCMAGMRGGQDAEPRDGPRQSLYRRCHRSNVERQPRSLVSEVEVVDLAASSSDEEEEEEKKGGGGEEEEEEEEVNDEEEEIWGNDLRRNSAEDGSSTQRLISCHGDTGAVTTAGGDVPGPQQLIRSNSASVAAAVHGPAACAAAAAGGDYVLYWMKTAVRGHENPALDAARAAAQHLHLPLRIAAFVQPACQPYVNHRRVKFLLEGLRDAQRELRDQGLDLLVHVYSTTTTTKDGESDANSEGGGDVLSRVDVSGPCWEALLAAARHAALVVTEDMPVDPDAAWLAALVRQLELDRASSPGGSCFPVAAAGVAPQMRATSERPTVTSRLRPGVWAVDTACVVPMQLVGKAYERAYAFRSATEGLRRQRLRASSVYDTAALSAPMTTAPMAPAASCGAPGLVRQPAASARQRRCLEMKRLEDGVQDDENDSGGGGGNANAVAPMDV
ncbi:hypothetical protein VaNZ11_005346, partial [Volvox africanus]